MPPKARLSCTFLKACQAKWLVLVMGYSQNQAGHIIGVPAGTVCHIIHGRRFVGSFPISLTL
jgi:hypothetical protein